MSDDDMDFFAHARNAPGRGHSKALDGNRTRDLDISEELIALKVHENHPHAVALGHHVLSSSFRSQRQRQLGLLAIYGRMRLIFGRLDPEPSGV